MSEKENAFVMCCAHRLVGPIECNKSKNNRWSNQEVNFFLPSKTKTVFTDACTCSIAMDTKSSKTRFTQ